MTLSGTYIRGLYEAWSRMDKSSDLAKLIETYVTVQVSYDNLLFLCTINIGLVRCTVIITQFNALHDLAKSPNHDWYSSRWSGPYADSLFTPGQYIASNVLNAALSIAYNQSNG